MRRSIRRTRCRSKPPGCVTSVARPGTGRGFAVRSNPSISSAAKRHERVGLAVRTRQTLDPYYERAAPIVGIGRFEFDWRWWNDQYGIGRPVMDEAVFRSAVTQISQCSRFGAVYRDEFACLPDVRGVAVRQRHEPRGRARWWPARSRRTYRRSVAASSGSKRATSWRPVASRCRACCWLRRGDIRPTGVGNEHDLVGRHFMEHLSTLGGGFLADVSEDVFRCTSPHSPGRTP